MINANDFHVKLEGEQDDLLFECGMVLNGMVDSGVVPNYDALHALVEATKILDAIMSDNKDADDAIQKFVDDIFEVTEDD